MTKELHSMEFCEPYIYSTFEKFANIMANGRGANYLKDKDPILYFQLLQAFAVAFSQGTLFGREVTRNGTEQDWKDVDESLKAEAKSINGLAKKVANILGVRTRSSREMGMS